MDTQTVSWVPRQAQPSHLVMYSTIRRSKEVQLWDAMSVAAETKSQTIHLLSTTSWRNWEENCGTLKLRSWWPPYVGVFATKQSKQSKALWSRRIHGGKTKTPNWSQHWQQTACICSCELDMLSAHPKQSHPAAKTCCSVLKLDSFFCQKFSCMQRQIFGWHFARQSPEEKFQVRGCTPILQRMVQEATDAKPFHPHRILTSWPGNDSSMCKLFWPKPSNRETLAAALSKTHL